MLLKFDLTRTIQYDDLQDLVANMCTQEPIINFSIFKTNMQQSRAKKDEWVDINYYFDQDAWDADDYPYVYEMSLVDSIAEATLYDHDRKHVLTSDLKISRCTNTGETYAAQNFLEFELVEVEISYNYNTNENI